MQKRSLYPDVTATSTSPTRGDEPGHWTCDEAWRERFHAFLEHVGCDGYGYADNDSALARFAPSGTDDTTSHYVIDTPLFTIRPYYWGDDDEVSALPNFVYKPWSYAIDWYKYPLRDAMANCRITDKEFYEMLATCESYVDNLAAEASGLSEPRALPSYRDKRTEADRWAAIWRKRLHDSSAKSDELWSTLANLVYALGDGDKSLVTSALEAAQKHTRVVVWDDEVSVKKTKKLDGTSTRITFVRTEHDIDDFADDADIFAN